MPTPRGMNRAQKCTLSPELVRTLLCAGASAFQADIARQPEGRPHRVTILGVSVGFLSGLPAHAGHFCCLRRERYGTTRPAARTSGRNLGTADSMGNRGAQQLIEHFRSASAYPRNFRPSRRRDSLRRRHVRQVRENWRRHPSDLTYQGRSRPDQGRERRDPCHVGRSSGEGTCRGWRRARAH